MARRRRPTRAAAHRAVVRAARNDYDAILAFQGGVCAICGKPPAEDRRHCIDHDHKTMEVRGILCTGCNRKLTGRHTADWMASALRYLEIPPYRTFLRRQS